MNNPSPGKDESIQSALNAMKANRPLRAEEICRNYLHLNPGCVHHIRLLAHALMKQNRLPEAEEQLRFALEMRPGFPHLHENLGTVLARQKRFEEAVESFKKAIEIEPSLTEAHKKLGNALAAMGRGVDADESYREYFDRESDKGAVAVGANHLKAGRFDEAIKAFRGVLKTDPDNVDALRHLAVVLWREKKKLGDAEALLRRATAIAPDYTVAWLNLGAILLEHNDHTRGIECFLKATQLEPDNPGAWGGLGNAYALATYSDKAVQAFARSVKLSPDSPMVQMGYAHVLKTVGDQEGSLAAYRAAVSGKPDFGEVYWSMANLKVFTFEDEEIEEMNTQLESDALTDSANVHIRFALGKAYEDRKDFDSAWKYYDSGNQMKRPEMYYDPLETKERHEEIMEVFSKEFVAEHEGNGVDDSAPILIVGLPRSGSTLIEQVLASHSQVEGTAELPNLSAIAQSIGRYRADQLVFPKALKDIRKKDWRAYGRQYMEETRRFRELGRDFFTDKLPNNFSFIGFLHLILPNAKVINARRHPYDSCLGNYKQLFGKGQNFTYDVYDLAEYYKSYHALMNHWHEVLPGKVLDVHYEETVENLETQVRRILDHCGLPFEEACLRFHESDRAVRTASSEQVRQPIYRGALGTWRKYEKHLDVWKDQLGDIVEELPEIVRNAGLD